VSAKTTFRLFATAFALAVLLSPTTVAAQAADGDPLAPYLSRLTGMADDLPTPTILPGAAAPAQAQATVAAAPAGPVVDLKINASSEGGGYVAAIKIFLLLTVLSMAPAILMSVTSFTRIIVVLSLLRHAVGVQSLPPSRVLVGVALFLSIFTMSPVLRAVDVNALTPWEKGEIDGKEAARRAIIPLREFMLAHTRPDDLELFMGLSGQEEVETVDDLSTFTLIPAFMTSELKTSFQMGAMLFLPFLVIDLVVASVLMSMGMMMLPPVMVSLPIKLFVFVLSDGWGLVLRSLAESVMLPVAVLSGGLQ
jgi:flagellar biosynthetic protein FliP